MDTAALNNDFDNFYVRRLKMRINDCSTAFQVARDGAGEAREAIHQRRRLARQACRVPQSPGRQAAAVGRQIEHEGAAYQSGRQ